MCNSPSSSTSIPPTSSAIDRISAELEHHDGLETVRQIGDVPHLSLAIYDDFPSAELAAKVAGFAATLTPVPLRSRISGSLPVSAVCSSLDWW